MREKDTGKNHTVTVRFLILLKHYIVLTNPPSFFGNAPGALSSKQMAGGFMFWN